MKKIVPEYKFSDEQLNNIKALALKCGLLEDTVKILFGRGIDDAEKIKKFLNPSRSNFISPFKMSGMSEAVELITRARDEEWAVVVYGDYDADGICASTILSRALCDFGIEPLVYVPERRDGYGLNKSAIDEIFEEFFPQLFITVDCGISCAEEVEYIKEQGAEVIVTDHHELPSVLPDCICINPKFDDGYIYDNLCGAGVALKVGVALNGESSYKYLDFAAIATVADSVPLVGENRDIVAEGLKLINKFPRSSYSKLLTKADSAINSQTVAFGIAPKINAAGRMGDAKAALALFTSNDENEIFNLAAKLTEYNVERQKYCDELYLSAKSKIKERGAYGRLIMLWDESWNTGFVGIVAARLAEEYSRPVILFVKNGETLKGSARSVESVNIFEALKSCDKYIKEYGGHSQAAGVNVEIENFENLQSALNEYLSANYNSEDFEPTVYVSGTLSKPYSARFAEELELFEPFGVGNKRPMFAVEEGALEARPIKPLSPHIDIKSDKIELLFFGGSKFSYFAESRAPKTYLFEYNISEFRGRKYIKGLVRDIVYKRDAGEFCAEEIAVNNVLTLANLKISCALSGSTIEKIEEIAGGEEGYGTIYIASEYSTLSHYKNLSRLPVELFYPSAGNLADCVLISPRADADLSGYKRVIFLDDTPLSARIASLEGKELVMCRYVSGYNFLRRLNTERAELLKIFSAVSANAGNLNGENSGEVALKNNLGFSPVQVAFALEVFRQLSLISYEGGKIFVHRGIKTDLNNSELYNMAKDLPFAV